MKDSSKKRILIVDDEKVNLKLSQRILIAKGYEIALAESGKIALQLVHTFRPDLILLDIRMPLMNGIEVCKTLKNDNNTNHIPVIILSTNHNSEDVQLGQNAGANGYLFKPIDPDVLISELNKYL